MVEKQRPKTALTSRDFPLIVAAKTSRMTAYAQLPWGAEKLGAGLRSDDRGEIRVESKPACWPAKPKPSSIADKHGHKLLNGGTKHKIDIHCVSKKR